MHNRIIVHFVTLVSILTLLVYSGSSCTCGLFSSGSKDGEIDILKMIPWDSTDVMIIDVRAALESGFYDALEDGNFLQTLFSLLPQFALDIESTDYLVSDITNITSGGFVTLIQGEFDPDEVRLQMEEDFEPGEYEGAETWRASSEDNPIQRIALIDDLFIFGSEREVKSYVEVLTTGKASLGDGNVTPEIVDRLSDGIRIDLFLGEGPYKDCIGWGTSIEAMDSTTGRLTILYAFGSPDAAQEFEELEGKLSASDLETLASLGLENCEFGREDNFFWWTFEGHISTLFELDTVAEWLGLDGGDTDGEDTDSGDSDNGDSDEDDEDAVPLLLTEMDSGATYGLGGVWGSSSSDVFAVGGSGTVLHYDGSSWSSMSSGSTEWLNGVWGSSGSDVFAVGGEGTILHYDGSSWSSMSSGSSGYLTGVWGSSSSDVFAVGNSGTVLHYDGSSWSSTSSGSSKGLDGVWGSSSSDVFAVGSAVLHYDGSSWSSMTSGFIICHLHGVWGSSSSDVFAVGDYGTILHYDGSA